MTSFDPPTDDRVPADSSAPSRGASRIDSLADADPIDEIVLTEDIVGTDGEVIGEHIERIELVSIDGEDVVVIDDVRMVADDEGDLLITETVAVFDEHGDVMVDETVTIIDAEGDVMVEERVTATDADGEIVVLESVVVADAEEFDDLVLAERLRDELDGVESALARLDDGDYGRCENCGDEIDDAILAATPQAVRCGAHLL